MEPINSWPALFLALYRWKFKIIAVHSKEFRTWFWAVLPPLSSHLPQSCMSQFLRLGFISDPPCFFFFPSGTFITSFSSVTAETRRAVLVFISGLPIKASGSAPCHVPLLDLMTLAPAHGCKGYLTFRKREREREKRRERKQGWEKGWEEGVKLLITILFFFKLWLH